MKQNRERNDGWYLISKQMPIGIGTGTVKGREEAGSRYSGSSLLSFRHRRSTWH